MDLSPESLREQFHAKGAELAVIEAELAPLRADLDALVAGETELSVKDAREREAALRVLIEDAQSRAYPIEMERATLCRALGGKTGPAPE